MRSTLNGRYHFKAMYLHVLLLLITAFSRISCTPVPADGHFTLNIIHYNDFHARFDDFLLGRTICLENVTSCIGGFARLYTLVKDLSVRNHHSLILNAGDSFQGTAWYNVLKWNVTQHFMNLIPHDAHAIGNHEFDSGIDGLVPYLSSLVAPVLAANIDAEEEPTMKRLIKKSIILKRHNKKIGIIGVTTTTSQTNYRAGKLKFLDEKMVVKKEATELKQQGVDVVIVLSHCGLDADRQLANATGDLVNIIVGGHSHSLLYTGEPPSHETVEGDYPVVFNHSSGKQVLIVQASCYTKYLGQLAVTFGNDGRIISWSGKPLFLDSHVQKDAMILRELVPYREEVKKVYDTIIGYSNVTMKDDVCYSGECTLGDVICDAYLDKARNHSRQTIQLCIINSRAIRSSLYSGAITMGNIMEILPFNNSVNVFKIKGKYLKSTLEYSVSQAWKLAPFVGPRTVQVSGLQIVFNLSAPIGSRIKTVTVKNTETGLYQEVENEKRYSVVSIEYIVNGGDSYIDISDNVEDLSTVGIDLAFFEEYVRQNTPISKMADGRIVMLQ